MLPQLESLKSEFEMVSIIAVGYIEVFVNCKTKSENSVLNLCILASLRLDQNDEGRGIIL